MPKLKTRKVNGVLFTESSGNIWYDLGYPDAEERQAKSSLALAIRRRVEALGLTQAETAKRLGITQPRVSEIFNLHVHGYTLDKLSTLLLRLGATVRVTVDFVDKHGGLHVEAA
jgi:predicted XRE-type DNA-binding protein